MGGLGLTPQRVNRKGQRTFAKATVQGGTTRDVEVVSVPVLRESKHGSCRPTH